MTIETTIERYSCNAGSGHSARSSRVGRCLFIWVPDNRVIGAFFSFDTTTGKRYRWHFREIDYFECNLLEKLAGTSPPALSGISCVCGERLVSKQNFRPRDFSSVVRSIVVAMFRLYLFIRIVRQLSFIPPTTPGKLIALKVIPISSNKILWR